MLGDPLSASPGSVGVLFKTLVNYDKIRRGVRTMSSWGSGHPIGIFRISVESGSKVGTRKLWAAYFDIFAVTACLHTVV